MDCLSFMVDPLLVVVIATVSGAILNTIRGFLGSESSYDIKKFFGAVIVAGIAIAQTIALSGIDLLGLALIGLTAGFSVDYAVSKAKKLTED
jgi:ribose/xylose/arabinose/galactoside ABC-type transport system permease subunit